MKIIRTLVVLSALGYSHGSMASDSTVYCPGPGYDFAAHTQTCEGRLTAPVVCKELTPDQLWFPDEEDRPNLPPALALRMAEDELRKANIIPGHAKPKRFYFQPCRAAGGWFFVVQFDWLESCGDSLAPELMLAGVPILMDGTVVVPSPDDTKVQNGE